MPYQGGKSQPGAYHTLINLMPPHRVYIEAFLGGGAVMRYKKPAEINIGIDLDRSVISRWPPPAETGRVDRHAVELPRLAGNGASAVAVRNGHSAERARWRFLSTDALRFLKTYQFTGDELVYCDPPYLLSARSQVTENYYRHEMSDLQHRDLLRILRQLKCKVMISGYASHLYSTLLKGWNEVTYTAWTHRHEPRTEHVWFNYPQPVALHDYRYLGTNYRERQDIRRQQMRWKRKLEKMPLVKRQALLSAIAGIG
jgi:hypothetical protein